MSQTVESRSLLDSWAVSQQLTMDLTRKLAGAQAVLRISHEVAGNPSPPLIVESLRQHLFDQHVSSAAILIYGEAAEDAQPGQRAYLEIQGTWSRRHGSGVGVGVSLYLSDYPDLLAQLDEHRIVHFPNVHTMRDRFDPLTSGFLQAARVRSLLLIALQNNLRHIGVLAIGMDKPGDFPADQLELYRQVSELITMSASAHLLSERQEQLEQHHSAMLNAVRDGVVMVLPFDKGGYVSKANRHFRTMFEVSDKDAEGCSLIDLLGSMRIAENTRQELRTAWLSIPARIPTVLRGEFRMTNEVGQPADIEWYSAPVYHDSHVLGRIYTFHDITPERTAQRLRAAFLSRVSHELRTPLTSIQGFAEFILEATGDNLPNLAREYTEIILHSAQHLNTVFTDMIEIARADAGELKLNKIEAHLPDVIINSVARLELQYRQKGQQVIMELDDDLPPVSIDMDKIAQVITNLLSNAIKYSPQGGKIRISTSTVEQAKDLPKSAPQDILLPAVMVTVRDQGKGLSREDVQQVFLPFYRTEDAKIARIEGVGLGLAVTRSLVEMHRGKIWAAPRGEVRGGCFIFTLPTL